MNIYIIVFLKSRLDPFFRIFQANGEPYQNHSCHHDNSNGARALWSSADHPNSPNVRRHTTRESEIGENAVTPTLSEADSSLGILPKVDLAAFTSTDQYIEDDIFESGLWRTPKLQLTGTQDPSQYNNSNLNLQERGDETLLPPRTCGHPDERSVMFMEWRKNPGS